MLKKKRNKAVILYKLTQFGIPVTISAKGKIILATSWNSAVGVLEVCLHTPSPYLLTYAPGINSCLLGIWALPSWALHGPWQATRMACSGLNPTLAESAHSSPFWFFWCWVLSAQRSSPGFCSPAALHPQGSDVTPGLLSLSSFHILPLDLAFLIFGGLITQSVWELGRNYKEC